MSKKTKYTPEDAKSILSQETTFKGETPLKEIQSHFSGLKENPSDIRMESPAGVVFFNLCLCYQNSGNISLGSVLDVMEGFKYSGIPSYVTMDGFKELKQKGYMTFTDPLGTEVFGDVKPDLYYRWTNKFYKLLLPKGENKKVEQRHDLKDTNV